MSFLIADSSTPRVTKPDATQADPLLALAEGDIVRAVWYRKERMFREIRPL